MANSDKGSSINDVTQFWTVFGTLSPSSLFYNKALIILLQNSWHPPPRPWCYLWTTPNNLFFCKCFKPFVQLLKSYWKEILLLSLCHKNRFYQNILTVFHFDRLQIFWSLILNFFCMTFYFCVSYMLFLLM